MDDAEEPAHRMHYLLSLESVLADDVEEDADELLGGGRQLLIPWRDRWQTGGMQSWMLVRELAQGDGRGQHGVAAGAADRGPAGHRRHVPEGAQLQQAA